MSSFQGAPDGEYQLLETQTDFAQKEGATEILILAREASGWKVAIYGMQ